MPDSTTFIIQAVNKSGNINLELFIDKETFPVWNYKIYTSSTENDKKSLEQYVDVATVGTNNEEDIWTKYLTEVTVTARHLPRSVVRASYVMDKEKINNASQNNGLLSVLNIIPRIKVLELYSEEPPIIQIFYDDQLFHRLVIDDQKNTPLIFENTETDDEYIYKMIKFIDPGKVTQIYLSEISSKLEIKSPSLHAILEPELVKPIVDLIIICDNINDVFYARERFHIKLINPLGYQNLQ